MKILKQIFNFIFTICLFLSLAALSVILLSKAINQEAFTSEILKANLVEKAKQDEDIALDKEFLTELAVSEEEQEQIDLNKVIDDYLYRLIMAKQRGSEELVSLDQELLDEAIGSKDIFYRRDYITKTEGLIAAEFDTLYDSARVNVLMKLGQSEELLYLAITGIIISVIALYIISHRIVYPLKIFIFSLGVMIIIYASVYGLLQIPIIKGKFLAVYLNVWLSEIAKLVLYLIGLLAIILAISISLVVIILFSKRN